MTIAHKVVERRTRNCSNLTLFIDGQTRRRRSANRIRNKYPEWFPVYKKGSTVTMAPNSRGILCFKTSYDAECFRAQYSKLFYSNSIVIKVKGTSKLPTPQENCFCSRCFSTVLVCQRNAPNLKGSTNRHNSIQEDQSFRVDNKHIKEVELW